MSSESERTEEYRQRLRHKKVTHDGQLRELLQRLELAKLSEDKAETKRLAGQISVIMGYAKPSGLLSRIREVLKK